MWRDPKGFAILLMFLIFVLGFFLARLIGLFFMTSGTISSRFAQAAFFAIPMTIIGMITTFVCWLYFHLPLFVCVPVNILLEGIIPVKFINHSPAIKKWAIIFAIVVVTYSYFVITEYY